MLARSSEPKDSAESPQQAWEKHPVNPFNLPVRRKWTITMVTASVTLLVGLNATAIATPAHQIAESFHVSDSSFPHSFWPITVWNTGAALGPMVGLPLLENFGNRSGYLVFALIYAKLGGNQHPR